MIIRSYRLFITFNLIVISIIVILTRRSRKIFIRNVRIIIFKRRMKFSIFERGGFMVSVL